MMKYGLKKKKVIDKGYDPSKLFAAQVPKMHTLDLHANFLINTEYSIVPNAMKREFHTLSPNVYKSLNRREGHWIKSSRKVTEISFGKSNIFSCRKLMFSLIKHCK